MLVLSSPKSADMSEVHHGYGSKGRPHQQSINLALNLTANLFLFGFSFCIFSCFHVFQAGLQTNPIISLCFQKCFAPPKTRLRLKVNRALLRKDVDLLCSFAGSSADPACVSRISIMGMSRHVGHQVFLLALLAVASQKENEQKDAFSWLAGT